MTRRKNPKYTHGFIDRTERPRFYLRLPGQKRVPLPGLPWSPEFMEAREIAMTAAEAREPVALGVGRTVAGTVNAALVSYYQCDAWTQGLAPTTRSNRRAILEKFREAHGDKRIALIHRQAMENVLKGKTPAANRNWRRALRGFMDHCLAIGLVSVDPLAGLTKLKLKSKSHHPWEIDECDQFEAFYPVGTRERLAYELLLQAGQSRCDVIRMGRQHIRHGILTMKRQKTAVEFSVNVTPMLQQAIDAMPSTNQLTFLLTDWGEPFASAASFGNWFRKVCRAAKMPARCTPHGLRAAAATYFAEKGATDNQLMAWFGWTSISQSQVYTKAANRKRMAAEAGKLIAGTGIGKS